MYFLEKDMNHININHIIRFNERNTIKHKESLTQKRY